MSQWLLLVFTALACAWGSEAVDSSLLLKTLRSEPYTHLQVLGEVTDIPGILVRTFHSPAHKQAALLLRKWMSEAGLHSWVDAVGNVHGTLPGHNASAKHLFVGSHYDTVIDGGKYDGQLGIVVGIAAVKSMILQELQVSGQQDVLDAILNCQAIPGAGSCRTQDPAVEGLAAAVSSVMSAGEASFTAGVSAGYVDALLRQAEATVSNTTATFVASNPTWLSTDDIIIPHEIAKAVVKRPVHIVAFADEEGVRFRSTFLGSRALVGTFLQHGALNSKDENGTTLAEVLRSEGWEDPAAAMSSLAVEPASMDAYVELHIEQGPVLEEKQLPLGGVSGIAGQVRLHVSINGEQGHAGTVPMAMRKDPMAAAAKMVSLVEMRCGGGPSACGHGPHGPQALPGIEGQMLVCTVGMVQCFPGASNVIAMQANFSVDIRTPDNALRDRVAANITASIHDICSHRGLRCTVEAPHRADAVHCDAQVTSELMEAIEGAAGLMEQVGIHPPASISEEAVEQGADLAPPARPSGPPPLLTSGAGHDAMAIAEVARIGMMFVRCRGGVSHSPLEYVHPDDAAAATAALTTFLRKRLLA